VGRQQLRQRLMHPAGHGLASASGHSVSPCPGERPEDGTRPSPAARCPWQPSPALRVPPSQRLSRLCWSLSSWRAERGAEQVDCPGLRVCCRAQVRAHRLPQPAPPARRRRPVTCEGATARWCPGMGGRRFTVARYSGSAGSSFASPERWRCCAGFLRLGQLTPPVGPGQKVWITGGPRSAGRMRRAGWRGRR
jgi:hypothetical protein